MANDSTVDQQQLQSTIDELYQTIKQLVRTSLSAIDVGDAQQLGELSLYTTLLEAAQAGQLGDHAAFVAMLNIAASDVGADPADTAAQLMNAHLNAIDPHKQYARLSAANDFEQMPTVGDAPIVESGSNSDGEWTRWADGTQDGTTALFTIPSSTQSVGNAYITGLGDRHIVNYPLPFISPPAPIGIFVGVDAFTVNAYGGTTTQCIAYLNSGISRDGLSNNARIHLRGRWK